MNYFIALVLPPVALYLSGKKSHALPSAVLFGLAIAALVAANTGAFMGGYAAGPVLYVLSLIHAFVFVHRSYQLESDQIHPHRGSASQSKPPRK